MKIIIQFVLIMLLIVGVVEAKSYSSSSRSSRSRSSQHSNTHKMYDPYVALKPKDWTNAYSQQNPNNPYKKQLNEQIDNNNHVKIENTIDEKKQTKSE